MSLSLHADLPVKTETDAESSRSRNERSLRIALRRWATALEQAPDECGPTRAQSAPHPSR